MNCYRMNACMDSTRLCKECKKGFDGRKDKEYCSPACKNKRWCREHPRVKSDLGSL